MIRLEFGVQFPCLSEYESEGFLSRRKALSKRGKAKMGIFKRAKTMNEQSSNNSDDEHDVLVVPFSALMQRKITDGSDGEEDDVPLVSFL